MEIHYTVTQDEIFKGENNLSTDVFSASSSSFCGETMLQVGKSYLLAGYHNEYHTLTINYCTFMRLLLNDNYFGGPPEWTLVDNNLLTKLRNKNFLPCSPKKQGKKFLKKLFDNFSTTFR
uniref:Uncharacterized protein n=1 Tax=Acrobeloides nanus TaxID=290746 RepID=A0A914E6N5_9BILA